ncbi:hypothetical protein AB0I60_26660 [Actinosynnema sp. NPDC050436]|uniref:hypothetical protein n=1 Tax=Actinosynnema sp. NPDC050436 TaxID=3155659 RepID=UPI0033C8A6A4
MTDEPEPLSTSVDVVLLRRDRASGLLTTVSGSGPVDLNDERLSPDVVEGLLADATVLAAPEGVTEAVVRAVQATAVPVAFAAQSWLRHHRALVFEDGRCHVSGDVLHYDEEFGVYTDDDL